MFNLKKIHTYRLAKCVALASVIALTTACSGGGGSSSGGSGGSDGNGGGTPNISIVTPMTLFKSGGKVRISGANLQNLTPVFASANITPTKQTNNLIELTLPAQSAGEHTLSVNGKDYNLTYRGAYTKVSSGYKLSCGLLPDKTVECWGINNSYQLGNGTGPFRRNHSYKPDFVKAPRSNNKLTNITDISVGFDHSCAVNTNSQVLCWGAAGGKGKRGDKNLLYGNDHASSNLVFSTFTPTRTHLTGASKVVAARHHSCALMTDKTVKCWGDAGDYRVGSGSGAAWFPTTVPGVSNVIALAAGNDHTCALKGDKTVMCWGVNSKGQLGKAVSPRSAPSAVAGLANVKQIAANQHHTCALLTDKTVKCWGNNDQGQVGNGVRSNTPVSSPSDVIKTVGGTSKLSNVAKIALGHGYSCALLENGNAKCWGLNNNYQLGDGTRANRLVPAYVKNGSSYLSKVTDISAGYNHTCAATEDSLLKCWGENSTGQLGNTTSVTSSAPVDIAIAGSKKQPLLNIDNVKQVAAGPHHSCAVLHDKTVKCWGRNDNAQIGSGAVTAGTSPQPPVSVGNIDNAVYVSAGEKHSCALLEDKTVKCWGRDQNGATGNPNRVGASQTLVPARVTGLSNVVQLVVSKGTHSCALLADSKVKCWGENGAGQLGNNAQGFPLYSATPVYVHTSKTDSSPLSGVKQITAGIRHTCAVLNDNTVKCWGYGNNGELGSYTAGLGVFYVKAPVPVAGLTNIKQVVAGAKHTCALYNTLERIRCWGQQKDGVLGNSLSTSATVSRPTDVRFLTLATNEKITKLSAGFYHTCALIGDSKVGCWGKASNKQLADNEIRMTYRTKAIEAKIFDGKIDDLSLGNEYSLFLQGSLVTTTKD